MLENKRAKYFLIFAKSVFFCDISPTTYKISEKKEIMLRHIKNVLSKEKIAKTHSKKELLNIVKSHSSILIRKLAGVDLRLQENKVTNIMIACNKINGIIIQPTRIDRNQLRTVEGIEKLIDNYFKRQ